MKKNKRFRIQTCCGNFYATLMCVVIISLFTAKAFAQTPGIIVEQPLTNELISGQSAVDYGIVAIGAGSPKTFTVSNTGGANLDGVSVRAVGANADNFIINIENLPATLPPSSSGSFSVTYYPNTRGEHIISLQITSYDQDESPFLVNLIGTCALPGNDDEIACGAFNIEFVTIGNPGNSADDTGYGPVAYEYRISKREVAYMQIEKYNALSDGPAIVATRPNNSSNSAPATSITWNDAARFINWLNTSCGYRPAYKFTTDTANDNIELWTSSDTGFDPTNPIRNSKAYYFLPTENEFYKAAYYDPSADGGNGGYWNYATGSDSAPTPARGSLTNRTAIYNGQTSGSETANAGGLSPYGTMAQNGNVSEWCESAFTPPITHPTDLRAYRGGCYTDSSSVLVSSSRSSGIPTASSNSIGFRVASKASPAPAASQPISLTTHVVDDFSDFSNFNAGNFTFYSGYNNANDYKEVVNGTLRVNPGDRRTGVYLWNAGHKLRWVGDRVSLELVNVDNGASGIQLDADFNPAEAASVRFYYDPDPRNNGRGEKRALFGPWGEAMHLDGTHSGNMFIEVEIIRVRRTCMDLRATFSGNGFTTIIRDLSIAGDELYFGTHTYIISGSSTYKQYVDNLVYKTGSTYSAWSSYHDLVTGINDSPSGDASGDGVSNAVYFAYDGTPLQQPYLSTNKKRSEIKHSQDGKHFAFTIPVRKGRVFSGTGPMYSNWAEGFRYELYASENLNDTWSQGVVEIPTVSTEGLPALRDVTGDDVADWEYRTFRIQRPVNEAPRGFLKSVINAD